MGHIINNDELIEVKANITNFIKRSVAYWADNGFCSENKIFFEEFDAKGIPLKNTKYRSRVQNRQLFTLAYCACHGFISKEKALEVISLTLPSIDKYFTKENMYIFDVNPDLAPNNTTIELYENAFAVLANTWIYRLTNDSNYLNKVRDIWDYIVKNMSNPHGGFNESVPNKLPRRQNPHMHLFEALMATYGATKDDFWKEKASEIYVLFLEKFYVKEYKVLCEYFDDQLNLEKGNHGIVIEAGHQFEWVWLLNEADKIFATNAPEKFDLYNAGMKGFNKETSLAIDEMNEKFETVKQSSRLWVQTEALKANVALYSVTKEDKYRIRATEIVNAIFANYIFMDKLIWTDYPKDTLSDDWHGTFSTLYHIVIAFNEYLMHC